MRILILVAIVLVGMIGLVIVLVIIIVLGVLGPQVYIQKKRLQKMHVNVHIKKEMIVIGEIKIYWRIIYNLANVNVLTGRINALT